MRNRVMLAGLLFLAACGGGSAAPQPDGPVVMGVVAGNHQVVPAARDAALPKPVDVQVYRGPNGQVALRVLDLLLPAKAYAQTTVQGVPNQVVCASAPDPKHALRAEVACANSDALGHATFVFHNDTVAGTSRAQVAAALATGTKITDSVSATVMAGPVNPGYHMQSIPVMTLPATVPDISVVDAFGNPIPFRIVPTGGLVVQDTTTGSVGARTITGGPGSTGSPNDQGFVVELRGVNNVLVGHGRYLIYGSGATIYGAGAQMSWYAAGLNTAYP